MKGDEREIQYLNIIKMDLKPARMSMDCVNLAYDSNKWRAVVKRYTTLHSTTLHYTTLHYTLHILSLSDITQHRSKYTRLHVPLSHSPSYHFTPLAVYSYYSSDVTVH